MPSLPLRPRLARDHPVFPPRRSLLRQLLPTLILLLILCCLPHHAGFITVPVSLVGLMYYGLSLPLLHRRHRPLRVPLRLSLLWLLAFGVLCSRHVWLAHQAEQTATDVSTRIERYHQSLGRYPKGLDQLGLTTAQLQAVRRYGLHYLHQPLSQPSQPRLDYPATWILLSHVDYDFTAHRWRLRRD